MILKGTPVLICRLVQQPEILNSSGMIITESPLACFDKAVSEKPGLIVIIFPAQIISMREQVIELTSCLKGNLLTRKIPVIVLIDGVNREMLVNLQKSGVESVKIYRADEPVDAGRIIDCVLSQDFSISLTAFLKKCCPFLNSIPVDHQHDLTVCGAYRNRMVLGGERLHGVCETGNHQQCSYFLKPGTPS